ncbi:MAG: hypothetical protein H0U71_06515 [Gammaproteobacteria bacterium]|nr:hypothetical protein [Gammaproteobacteria bacterium]
MVDITSIKTRLKEKSRTNPELQSELKKAGVNVSDLDSMSSEQLKSMLSPKILGLAGLSSSDLDSSK